MWKINLPPHTQVSSKQQAQILVISAASESSIADKNKIAKDEHKRPHQVEIYNST